MNNTCVNCIYCVTDDGEPYYCAIKDLYTFVETGQTACEKFISRNEK